MIDPIQAPNEDPKFDPSVLVPLAGLVIVAAIAANKIFKTLEETVTAVGRAWDKADEAHTARALLNAYGTRQRWKKSDERALHTLPLNAVARRKVQRLSGTGRPIVKPHQPLAIHLLGKVRNVLPLVLENATPQERRRAFWHWPWHEACVEALYRGEHAQAKAEGLPDAARKAEEKVADALWISRSTVHQICVKVRRASDEDVHPPMRIKDFEDWMSGGSKRRFTK